MSIAGDTPVDFRKEVSPSIGITDTSKPLDEGELRAEEICIFRLQELSVNATFETQIGGLVGAEAAAHFFANVPWWEIIAKFDGIAGIVFRKDDASIGVCRVNRTIEDCEDVSFREDDRVPRCFFALILKETR